MPILLCWTGENVVGLNPTTSKLHWSITHPPTNMVINVPTPVVNGNRVFLSAFYDGSTMIRVSHDKKTAELLWHRQGSDEKQTDALHCMISTPLFLRDYIYGVDSYGQLRCLEADTGDRVWEDLTATRPARCSNIHMIRRGEDSGDNIWMFNEQGQLIIARLSPSGFEEISRTQLIQPTTEQLRQRGGVCWSHPAFAKKISVLATTKSWSALVWRRWNVRTIEGGKMTSAWSDPMPLRFFLMFGAQHDWDCRAWKNSLAFQRCLVIHMERQPDGLFC